MLATLAASHLHWRAGSKRSFTATQKKAGLFCGSFLRKGEVFVHAGRNQNLNDLKDLRKGEVFAYVGLHQNLKDRKLTHERSLNPTTGTSSTRKDEVPTAIPVVARGGTFGTCLEYGDGAGSICTPQSHGALGRFLTKIVDSESADSANLSSHFYKVHNL